MYSQTMLGLRYILVSSLFIVSSRGFTNKFFKNCNQLPFQRLLGHKQPQLTRFMSNEVEAAAIAASSDPAINPKAPSFFDKIVSKGNGSYIYSFLYI